MKILIVEDEEKTAVSLKRGFAEINVVVDITGNGLDALAMARKTDYDAIILDVMIPGIDGWEVVKRLRAEGNPTPVLFLTARDEVKDRITGLQLGGDDYLVKPFSFTELAARLQSVLRRGRVVQQDVLRVADLEVNFFAHRVTRGGKLIDLTKKEFAILSLLIRRSGEVLSRARIAERIWNMSLDRNLKIVDVQMGNLRAKVDEGFPRKLIHTVRGIGYVLEDRGEQEA